MRVSGHFWGFTRQKDKRKNNRRGYARKNIWSVPIFPRARIRISLENLVLCLVKRVKLLILLENLTRQLTRQEQDKIKIAVFCLV